MTKLAAISQADLLRLLLEPNSPGLNDTSAEFLGYERTQTPSVSGRVGFFPTAKLGVDHSEFPEQPSEEPDKEFPADRPKLKFLMPVRAETLKTDPPDQDAGNPITDKDLRVPWEWPAPPHQPLIAWSRLAPFLKNRLGSQIRGVRLDERKLMRQVCTGQPLRALPRRMRTGWAAQAVVLWDDTPEMFPFVQDIQWLNDHLMRERGSDGLKVITISNMQSFGEVLAMPTGVPVLAISAMGQHSQNVAVQSAWRRLSRKLEFRRQDFHALTPCPRHRWTSPLARAWSASAWDRGQRLPREGGMAALPSDERFADVTEALLNLLAPASRIEPPLLREARLLLGPSADLPSADIGTEWDAWHHSDCWHSDDCFGFQTGATYERRLHRPFQHFKSPEENRQLATTVSAAIRKHHQSFAKIVAFEAELRAILRGTSDLDGLELLKSVLKSVVDRLRRIAVKPNCDEGRRTGLPAWFVEMTERLSPDMRKDMSVGKMIAQGLALAHTWQVAVEVVVPPGVNPEAYAEEFRRAAMRIRNSGSPVEYIIGHHESNLSFFPANKGRKPQVPLGRILSAENVGLNIEVQGSLSTHHSLQLHGGFHSGISLDSMPEKIRIESSHGMRHFETIERPSWADRFWYDCFGIAAEFNVRNTTFVLRWIPPGRFLMGSPEYETGRYQNEGPQHEVTISRGYWLGETPVTKRQWKAVIEAGIEQGQLGKELYPEDPPKTEPSFFLHSADQPVEQITWMHATAFCRVLKGLLQNSPKFCLPTEAQWEYACRAGTQSAFNDGSDSKVRAGNYALYRLGWFDDNSGDTTHPVKRKPPNAWGLCDMHGNVWEWCFDSWDDNAYEHRKAGVVDPVLDVSGAGRVVRGGSWGSRAQDCRATYRKRGPGGPFHDSYNGGMRLSAGYEFGSAEPPAAERLVVPKRRNVSGLRKTVADVPIPVLEMIPAFPPLWAEVFGEDKFGIFAECSVDNVSFVWRWIPPGQFQMGSPDSENRRFDNEGPAHPVTITRGFWMRETPITQKQ